MDEDQDYIHPGYLITPTEFEIIPDPVPTVEIPFEELSSSHPWLQLTSGAMKLISNGWRLPDAANTCVDHINFHLHDPHHELSQSDINQYDEWAGESQAALARFAALVHYLEQKEEKQLSLPYKPYLGTDSYRNLLNFWQDGRKTLELKRPGTNTRKNKVDEIPAGFAEWCFKFLCDHAEGLNILANIICSHLNYAQDCQNNIEYQESGLEDYYTTFKKKDKKIRFFSPLQEWQFFQRKLKFPKFKEKDREEFSRFFNSCCNNKGFGRKIDAATRTSLKYLKENPDEDWIFNKAEKKQYINYFNNSAKLEGAISRGRQYLYGIGTFTLDSDTFWEDFTIYRKHRGVMDLDMELDFDVLNADYTLIERGIKSKKFKHLKELTEAEKQLRLAQAKAAQAKAEEAEAQKKIDTLRAELGKETRPAEVSNVTAGVIRPKQKATKSINLKLDSILADKLRQASSVWSQAINTPISADMLKDPSTTIKSEVLQKFLSGPLTSITSNQNIKDLEQKGKDIDTAKSSGKLDEYKQKLGGKDTCTTSDMILILRPDEKLSKSNRNETTRAFIKNYGLIPTKRGKPRTKAQSLNSYLTYKLFKGLKPLKEASEKKGFSLVNQILAAENPETPFKKIIKEHFGYSTKKEQEKHIKAAEEKYPVGQILGVKNAEYKTADVALALCKHFGDEV